CVGIGTPDGELIPVIDACGKRVLLKDKQGDVVKTRLDEKTLQEIASITEGGYVRGAGAELGLDLIYEEKLSKMEKHEFEGKMAKKYNEKFQIFVFFAVLFLIGELFINETRNKT
ncbi:MAG: hypothetical protein WCY34_06770, partial [Candidatus Omnitrophota bacterium]